MAFRQTELCHQLCLQRTEDWQSHDQTVHRREKIISKRVSYVNTEWEGNVNKRRNELNSE